MNMLNKMEEKVGKIDERRENVTRQVKSTKKKSIMELKKYND